SPNQFRGSVLHPPVEHFDRLHGHPKNYHCSRHFRASGWREGPCSLRNAGLHQVERIVGRPRKMADMFAQSKDWAQIWGRNLSAPARMPRAMNKRSLGIAESRLDLRPSRAACEGFSLFELIVSMAILLVISGGIFSAISSSQQSYARTELKSDMYENVRGVAELMAQKIGQAGLVNLPATTLGAAVNANITAQTVNVSSTASMFVNEQVLVDAGTNNEELVTLTGITASTITAIFGKAHATGVPINVLGVFPNGIVAPATTDGSTANVLNLFGDLNADGSLVYVRYTCTPGTAAAPGTLARS